jgi:hypothetical protein
MHSQYVTSTAQDDLDALIYKYPPCLLAITLTKAITNPLPDSTTVQDMTLPNTPTTTALAESGGWKTVEGKTKQKKRRNYKAHNKWAVTTVNNTLTMKTGRRGKNT